MRQAAQQPALLEHHLLCVHVCVHVCVWWWGGGAPIILTFTHSVMFLVHAAALLSKAPPTSTRMFMSSAYSWMDGEGWEGGVRHRGSGGLFQGMWGVRQAQLGGGDAEEGARGDEALGAYHRCCSQVQQAKVGSCQHHLSMQPSAWQALGLQQPLPGGCRRKGAACPAAARRA